MRGLSICSGVGMLDLAAERENTKGGHVMEGRKTIRILDLCCGAGGAAKGYCDAFTEASYDVEITGVDLKPQPNYPYMMRVGDALTWPLWEYDFIHVSPPCQKFSRAQVLQNREHPDVLTPMRKRLQSTGVPWIIENVIGAPMGHFVTLCGTHFGLKVYRHRQFESNIMLMSPGKCQHPHYLMDGYCCVYGDQVRGRQVGKYGNDYPHLSVAYARQAMGISWMTQHELAQAIPPAYTRFLGRQIIAAIENTSRRHSPQGRARRASPTAGTASPAGAEGSEGAER